MRQIDAYDHIARIYGSAAAERWLHDTTADERRQACLLFQEQVLARQQRGRGNLRVVTIEEAHA